MKFCGGAVVDATTGCQLTYPWSRDARVRWKCDLLIHNGDQWMYMASSNSVNSQTFQGMIQKVESGVWRIVEAQTGQVLRQSPAEHLCLN